MSPAPSPRRPSGGARLHPADIRRRAASEKALAREAGERIESGASREDPPMSKTRIFIDGSAGTTGLRIRERLAAREDLELLALPEERRKDPAARAEAQKTVSEQPSCVRFTFQTERARTESASAMRGSRIPYRRSA